VDGLRCAVFGNDSGFALSPQDSQRLPGQGFDEKQSSTEKCRRSNLPNDFDYRGGSNGPQPRRSCNL
jgi:hypothetical protein